MFFNSIDETRRTAIYVRISAAMQKTDRQVEDLVDFAKTNRPNLSILMTKLELGEYKQVLFSEFSRLERKPTNLLRDLEMKSHPYNQSHPMSSSPSHPTDNPS